MIKWQPFVKTMSEANVPADLGEALVQLYMRYIIQDGHDQP